MLTLDRNEICQLIPHAGRMCLLEEVEFWDENSIRCHSSSHLEADHPLQHDGNLSSIHLIEYSAQAMATHGGLVARKHHKVLSNGYLAMLKEVNITMCDLSKTESPLIIDAERLMAVESSFIYQFGVTLDGELLASGRATVVGLIESDKDVQL